MFGLSDRAKLGEDMNSSKPIRQEPLIGGMNSVNVFVIVTGGEGSVNVQADHGADAAAFIMDSVMRAIKEYQGGMYEARRK